MNRQKSLQLCSNSKKCYNFHRGQNLVSSDKSKKNAVIHPAYSRDSNLLESVVKQFWYDPDVKCLVCHFPSDFSEMNENVGSSRVNRGFDIEEVH